MFHARAKDGLSQRIRGLGDFEDAEDAAAQVRHHLQEGGPPPDSEGFVEADDGEVVYTATLSDKGNVSGSWKEEKAQKVAAKRREAEES